eukprot:snap_masked-scaffold_9-processed-gene-0.12-mRNA-1 protein AED:1.00 eAED:1.00 QI:0/-1/0/0/-1/1/1/0/325
MACETKLMSKDGVYLKESRDLNFDEGDRIWAAPANRFQILMKCTFDGEPEDDLMDNSYALIMDTPHENNRAEAENIKHSVAIMQFEVRKTVQNQLTLSTLSENSLEEGYTFQTQSCRPRYLPDMTAEDLELAEFIPDSYSEEILATIRQESRDYNFSSELNGGENTFNITVTPFDVNGDYFRGYYTEDRALNISVLQLQNYYQFSLNHGHHPLHIHVNHGQLQTVPDDGSNYHRVGDFFDTVTSACLSSGCVNTQEGRPEIERTLFRMYIDRYHGRMIAHCHNMDHSDNLALGEFWILDDPDSTFYDTEPLWEEDCPDVISIVET